MFIAVFVTYGHLKRDIIIIMQDSIIQAVGDHQHTLVADIRNSIIGINRYTETVDILSIDETRLHRCQWYVLPWRDFSIDECRRFQPRNFGDYFLVNTISIVESPGRIS